MKRPWEKVSLVLWTLKARLCPDQIDTSKLHCTITTVIIEFTCGAARIWMIVHNTKVFAWTSSHWCLHHIKTRGSCSGERKHSIDSSSVQKSQLWKSGQGKECEAFTHRQSLVTCVLSTYQTNIQEIEGLRLQFPDSCKFWSKGTGKVQVWGLKNLRQKMSWVGQRSYKVQTANNHTLNRVAEHLAWRLLRQAQRTVKQPNTTHMGRALKVSEQSGTQVFIPEHKNQEWFTGVNLNHTYAWWDGCLPKMHRKVSSNSRSCGHTFASSCVLENTDCTLTISISECPDFPLVCIQICVSFFRFLKDQKTHLWSSEYVRLPRSPARQTCPNENGRKWFKNTP